MKQNSCVDFVVKIVNLEAINSKRPAALFDEVPTLKNRIFSESTKGPLSFPGIPVAVIFVDCCDSSNVFMVYEVPSFGSDYTGTFYIESSGFNGCATVITPNVRPSLVYEYISLVKQTIKI